MKTVPLRLGVMGTADIAVSRVIPNLKKSEKVLVRAISSRDEERAKHWARRLNIEQHFGSYGGMLEGADIEAVYIPLVNSLHAEWTIRALQKGKHVLCEKPLALTADDVQSMIRTARERRLVLMEAFMYRYHPRNLEVFNMVAAGGIGELKVIESAFSYVLDDPASYLMKRDLGGGALNDVGCYSVNVARMVTGSEPVEVYGTANYTSGRSDMSFQGSMRFPGSVLSSFHVAMDQEPRYWYRVIGDEGLIEVPWAFVSFGRKTHIVVQKNEKEQKKMYDGVDEYRLEFEHFSELIRGTAQPLYPIEDSTSNIRVMEALHRSAIRGKPVRL
jgi:predicted dehydrogenase